MSGWLPPPRPIFSPPSWLASDSDQVTRWKILLDWAHDEDLKSFITNNRGLLWEMGGAAALGGHYEALDTDKLIAFYFLSPSPTAQQIADFAIKYDIFIDTNPDPGDPGQQVRIPTDAPGYTRTIPSIMPAAAATTWHGLDDAVNKVIAKRSALGPLPANQYLDGDGNLANPIIINYYDDVWIKRIKYPTGSLQAAALQPQWWNTTGVTMEQWGTNSTDVWGNHSPASSSDPDAAWYDDGWDFAKGTGAFFDVVHAIVAVLGIALSATGLGTVVAAFIVAILNIVADIVQGVEDQIMGGNGAGALVNMGQAILSVGSAELGQLGSVSPALAKLGQSGMKYLGATLKQIGTTLTPEHTTLNMQDALTQLQLHASEYGVMDQDQFEAVLAIISGNGSVGVPLAQSGWDTAQYAPNEDIIGIGKIYEQFFSGPAAALWKLGAQLGALSKAQGQQGVSVFHKYLAANVKLGGAGAIALMTPLSPQDDLMKYVRETLKPRYNL